MRNRYGRGLVLIAVPVAMHACESSTGPQDETTAEFTPVAGTYYVLQTVESVQADRCLEGNRLAPTSTLEGAAFMDDCQDVSGQRWKFVDAEGGGYRMQTMFREAANECLEDNGLDPGAPLQGAAYMDVCGNSPGQLWSVVRVGDGRFHLKTADGGSTKCLDGNRVTQGATAGGGAFMNDCSPEAERQLWVARIGSLTL